MRQESKENDLVKIQLTAFFVVLAFAFVPAGLLVFPMADKELGMKDQLMVSGCTATNYWLAALAFDMLLCVFAVAACVVVLVVCGADPFLSEMSSTLLLFFTYMWASCGMCYCTAQVFSSQTGATIFTLALNGIACLLLVTVALGCEVGLATKTFSILVGQIKGTPGAHHRPEADLIAALESDSDYQRFWRYAARAHAIGSFLPSYELADGMIRLASRHLVATIPYKFVMDMTDSMEDKIATQLADTASQMIQSHLDLIPEASPFLTGSRISTEAGRHVVEASGSAMTKQKGGQDAVVRRARGPLPPQNQKFATDEDLRSWDKKVKETRAF